MHELLKFIKEKNSTPKGNKNQHFSFSNIVSSTKCQERSGWKTSQGTYTVNLFIHLMKFFALIVLENNIIQYRKMRDCDIINNENDKGIQE